MRQLQVVWRGRRTEPVKFRGPEDVYRQMKFIEEYDREHFYVIHLDSQDRMLARELISIGTVNQTIVHPREVFKAALLAGSTSIITVHNHPSGVCTPSADDRRIFRELSAAGLLLRVEVKDHVIVGGGRWIADG